MRYCAEDLGSEDEESGDEDEDESEEEDSEDGSDFLVDEEDMSVVSRGSSRALDCVPCVLALHAGPTLSLRAGWPCVLSDLWPAARGGTAAALARHVRCCPEPRSRLRSCPAWGMRNAGCAAQGGRAGEEGAQGGQGESGARGSIG